MHSLIFILGDVSISDLLLHLLKLMLTLSSLPRAPPSLPPHHQHSSPDLEDFDPVYMIAHVFEEIIAGNTLGQHLFCNVSVTGGTARFLLSFYSSV